MSRDRAARLAKFKIDHPAWRVRREEDGSYLALRGTVLIAASSLERLGDLLDRAGPGGDDTEED